MNLRYAPRAEDDLAAILDGITRYNPLAALKIVAELRQKIESLAATPRIGRASDRGGLRTLWLAPYSYRLYYRLSGDDIVIIHIRHTSRRPLGS